MTVIICIDDNKGMMFNYRRQSQDRELRSRIIKLAGDNKLWMNACSYKQFSDCTVKSLVVDEDFLEKAGDHDYCFIEDQDITPYLNRIETIILYKWNRKYPADFFLTADMSEWKLISQMDFEGCSHEKITEERYTRL